MTRARRPSGSPTPTFLSEAQQRRLIRDYRRMPSPSFLTAKYRVSWGTVYNVLRRRGVQPRRRLVRLGPAAQAQLVHDYERGHSMSRLAASYGVSIGTVHRTLRRHGVPARPLPVANRRRRVDETAFDTVTEASAYWIGFLMADGSIDPRGRGNGSPVVTLTVAECDVGHMTAFRRFLDSNHTITRTREEVKIAIASPRLAEALARHGVVPRKTRRTRCAAALALDEHFWRGVVDGDGSVIVRRPTRVFPAGVPVLILYGSAGLLGQFRRFVRRLWPGFDARIRPKRGCWCLTVKHRAAHRTLRALYGDCSVALPRKMRRARALLAAPPTEGVYEESAGSIRKRIASIRKRIADSRLVTEAREGAPMTGTLTTRATSGRATHATPPGAARPS